MSFTLFVINTVNTVFEVVAFLLLLRAWMQYARTDFYNPMSQFVVRSTQPLVGPVRKILPSFGPVDSASLLLAYLFTVLKIILLVMIGNHGFFFQFALLIGSLFTFIKTVGKLVFWVLIIRALMSWISQGRSPVEFVLIQLTEPFLSVIRRFLPSMGGLDFSVMIALFILTGLNYLGTDISSALGYGAFWTFIPGW